MAEENGGLRMRQGRCRHLPAGYFGRIWNGGDGLQTIPSRRRWCEGGLQPVDASHPGIGEGKDLRRWAEAHPTLLLVIAAEVF